MRRMERGRAEREGERPRTLHEIDFLLLVDDETRQGALRFAQKEGGPFLEEVGKRIPLADRDPKTALRDRRCDGRERHRGRITRAVGARLRPRQSRSIIDIALRNGDLYPERGPSQ
jgi:hypothetical protein